MNKNRKKGFTLVELLVVIAILAILAVVSVVGYTSFTKKGKIASDLSLTTQMNNILQAEEAGWATFETPSDAITALVDGGLDVRKLTPTTEGYIYVYNSLGKQGEKMILLDENYEVKAPEGVELDTNKISYYTFVSTQDEINKYSTLGYSVYLKDNYSSDTAYVSTSVDVGTNDTVTTINYTNTTAQTALIRTNNTRTTVNIYGPGDIVKHYGDAKEINIAEVAMSSYHENGTILGNINVAKGNVEIETKATVANVIITPVAKPKTSVNDTTTEEARKVEPSAESIKVEVKENAKVSTVQSTSSSVTVDSKVVSGTGATNVAKVSSTDSNVAYIGSQGYTNFNYALKAAREAKETTIVLTKDATLTDFYESARVLAPSSVEENKPGTHLNKGNKITIDLNGKTLTYSKADGQNNSNAIYVTNGTSLTIKNGTLKANEMNNGESGVIKVQTSSSVYTYGLTYETNGCAFFPQAYSAKVVIDNSEITAGCYVVCTNSSTDKNGNVEIDIKNSTLKSRGIVCSSGTWDNNSATVAVGLACTLNIENSKIYGTRQALVVRAGTANVKNTLISCDLTYSNEAQNDSNWGSLPNVPGYPVVIGDTDANEYNANAVCTFTNVTVENTNTGDYKNRYIHLASDGKYSTTFTYDSSSAGMNYNIRKDSKVTINGKEETGN